MGRISTEPISDDRGKIRDPTCRPTCQNHSRRAPKQTGDWGAPGPRHCRLRSCALLGRQMPLHGFMRCEPWLSELRTASSFLIPCPNKVGGQDNKRASPPNPKCSPQTNMLTLREDGLLASSCCLLDKISGLTPPVDRQTPEPGCLS